MDKGPKHLYDLILFDWLNEFEMLLNKHSSLGIGAEIYSLTFFELWCLYQWLKSFGS